MLPGVRAATAAALALAVSVTLVGAAAADPRDPIPSQQQVDQAQAEVAQQREGVEALQARLNAANARLEQAAVQAEIASEAYNGAVWELQEARKQTKVARQAADQAEAEVAKQRVGIVTLVTDSYQNGTELNTATAILSDEGPAGLMNRYGVVQSAGDSMQARYTAFKSALAEAKAATVSAEKAQRHQQGLADKAKQSRDAAAGAAEAAVAATADIERQKQGLIAALAKAQNVSVALAGQRQAALEKAAQEQAAAAAKARLEAQAVAMAKAQAAEAARAKAEQARKDREQADRDAQSTPGGAGSSTPPSSETAPPLDPTPPAPSTGGAAAAIAYAKAQLGKPYRWGATGPSSFDCSGLTMMAWKAGGKSLVRTSAAQFKQSTRISVAQLQPGDLVFWGGSPSSIHHVALYIGNGQILHAPRTGKPVQVAGLYYWTAPDYFGRP